MLQLLFYFLNHNSNKNNRLNSFEQRSNHLTRLFDLFDKTVDEKKK